MKKTASPLILILLLIASMSIAAQTYDRGRGSFNAPFALNHFADSGDGILVRVTGLERPADQMVGDMPPPGAEQEYIIISIEMECAKSRSENCVVATWDFEVAGDHGIIYPNAAEADESAFDFPPGTEVVGEVPALINSDDANLILLFYHFPTIPYTFPFVFATEEMPEASVEIPINATIGVIARVGPSSELEFTGVFNRGEQVIAHGRNNDGTWLEIQFGWVPAEFVEAEGDIMSLPVTSNLP